MPANKSLYPFKTIAKKGTVSSKLKYWLLYKGNQNNYPCTHINNHLVDALQFYTLVFLAYFDKD